MKILISFLLFCNICFSQNNNENYNGTYNLLDSEKGMYNKPTNTKIFEFGKENKTKLLAIAACKKCMPGIYVYQEAESKTLNIPVYFNRVGLYILGYDKESFVAVLVDKKLGKGEWTDFKFSNFYSKSKSKISGITKEKITNYAKAISKKMMK